DRGVLRVFGEHVRLRAAGLGGDALDAVAHELSVGIAGANRVDRDPARCGLGGERARQAHERVFRGAIGADIGIASEPRRRRHVDEAAEPALDHARQHRLGRIDRAHQVHVPHGAEDRGSALIKGPDSTEPALLMRMAIGPRAASAAVTCRLTSTTSVTSATPHPAASPAATAARSGASVRPITVTAAPARASAAATARPMPRPPPVTKACLPASAMAWSPGGRGIAAGRHTLSLKFLSFKLAVEIF